MKIPTWMWALAVVAFAWIGVGIAYERGRQHELEARFKEAEAVELTVGKPVTLVSMSETLSLPEAACRAAPFDTFPSPHVCEFHFEYPSAWWKEKGCHLAIYRDDSRKSLYGDVLWPMDGSFCRLRDARR